MLPTLPTQSSEVIILAKYLLSWLVTNNGLQSVVKINESAFLGPTTYYCYRDPWQVKLALDTATPTLTHSFSSHLENPSVNTDVYSKQIIHKNNMQQSHQVMSGMKIKLGRTVYSRITSDKFHQSSSIQGLGTSNNMTAGQSTSQLVSDNHLLLKLLTKHKIMSDVSATDQKLIAMDNSRLDVSRVSSDDQLGPSQDIIDKEGDFTEKLLDTHLYKHQKDNLNMLFKLWDALKGDLYLIHTISMSYPTIQRMNKGHLRPANTSNSSNSVVNVPLIPKTNIDVKNNKQSIDKSKTVGNSSESLPPRGNASGSTPNGNISSKLQSLDSSSSKLNDNSSYLSDYQQIISRYLYRNAMLSRLKLPYRFIGNIQVDVFGVKDIRGRQDHFSFGHTSTHSIEVYSLIKLTRPPVSVR